jgi:hypothetical protein
MRRLPPRSARSIRSLLQEHNIEPILVDVGASGSPPAIWNPIAANSVYVGFDPDLREFRMIDDGQFRRAIIVNKAVTGTEAAETVDFYLTKSPYCSSTLPPSMESLNNYLFADLFEVVGHKDVTAAPLSSILAEAGLDQLHWLKTDSQGTDLRIYQGLPPDIRAEVVAVDVEPGLIDAYHGEDLFSTTHEALSKDGFWLSNLRVEGSIRLRPATLERQKGRVSPRLMRGAARTSPGWVEARYLRGPDWLGQRSSSPAPFVLLWTFAVLDQQLGYALDVVDEYERLRGPDETSGRMRGHVTMLARGEYLARGAGKLAHRLLRVPSGLVSRARARD